MKISILTLFPEMFTGPFEHSILKRAQEAKKVTIELINIRNFGVGKHKIVDDRPFGGGTGMVMKVDVLYKAIQSIKSKPKEETKETNVHPGGGRTDSSQVDTGIQTVLLDPRGEIFKQKIAKEFSELSHLILICGHYEGIDERIRSLVDRTISIGDFILTGGEIPSMLITDAVVRLISGVLKSDATKHESFSYTFDNFGILEYPQYTHPREFNGVSVPNILLSGNHKEIEKWRKEKAVEITKRYRPDLIHRP